MTTEIPNTFGPLSALERFGSSPTAIITLNKDQRTFRVITNPNALQRLCHWLCQKFSFKTATSGANKTLIGRTLIQLLEVSHNGSRTQFSEVDNNSPLFTKNVLNALRRLKNETYFLEFELPDNVKTFLEDECNNPGLSVPPNDDDYDYDVSPQTEEVNSNPNRQLNDVQMALMGLPTVLPGLDQKNVVRDFYRGR